jgi:hypothetical protein
VTEPFCSQISLSAGEPLAGTAVAGTDRWIAIEHQPAWGPIGLEDSELPEAVLTQLMDLTRRHERLRVQLVRRERSELRPKDRAAAESSFAQRGSARVEREGHGTRVWFAECGDQPALYALELSSLEAFLVLSLDAWLRDEAPPPGVRESEPLYLVCVHGKRDRCCALLGLPVYRALATQVGERVLQTTHLGGHRFAATLLTLPAGICYGRLPPEEAAPLVLATQAGRLHDVARVRGRVAYASEAQAAEVLLRERLGEARLDALVLLATERAADGSFVVRFLERESGREHQVSLAREAMPAMPQSCGAPPKPAKRLVSLEARPRTL